MKKLKILSAIFSVFLFSITGCTNKTAEMQANIDAMNAEIEDLTRLTDELQDHLDVTTDKNDSLTTVLHTYNKAAKAVKKYTPEEKQLIGLVTDLNSAFNSILVTKDVQTVLSLFNEDFTSNVIMVSLYDVVNVRRGDAITYKEQLEHILLNNDKIKYIEVKLNNIKHIEVRNNDLGIIYFADDLTIVTNDSKKVTSRVLIQIVAKNYEGLWKIGNYTSVNMALYQQDM